MNGLGHGEGGAQLGRQPCREARQVAARGGEARQARGADPVRLPDRRPGEACRRLQ
jgi:hypothetical protein